MLIPCQVVLANPPWRESGPRGKKSPEYADLSSSQRVKFWPQMETGPFFIIFQLNPFKDLLKILVITTNIFTHYLLLFLLKKKNFIYVAAPGLSCGMWDLVLCPGIKPGAPALGVWSFGHWTMREVPIHYLPKIKICTEGQKVQKSKRSLYSLIYSRLQL